MSAVNEELLARLATEPPAVQQQLWRWLVGEHPTGRPEQAEECSIESNMGDAEPTTAEDLPMVRRGDTHGDDARHGPDPGA